MPKESEPITFEESIERLEALIEAMENGEIPLAELVTKFEEGSKLLRYCQRQLKDAELKIDILNRKTDEPEPFELVEES